MTCRRWIADEVSGRRAALSGDHADHLIRVLRVRVGQEFEIAAGSLLYRGRVASIGDQRVEFDLAEELPVSAAAQITLLLAIFKFDRMEWAIEKCTELGVARLVPLIASRSDAHLTTAAAKRVERWKRIAREASEQSRRATIPEVANPVKFSEGLSLPAQTRIVLSENEEATSLAEILRKRTEGSILLAIGPEGGWSQNEENKFNESGWISASFGSTILRAETAAIAATAIVISALG